LSKRRVVITGMGMLSPLGNTVEETWKGIVAGQNGIGLIGQFDTTQYSCKICGSVKNFDPTVYMTPKEARHMDPFIQYGVVAAMQARFNGNRGRSRARWCRYRGWYVWVIHIGRIS